MEKRADLCNEILDNVEILHHVTVNNNTIGLTHISFKTVTKTTHNNKKKMGITPQPTDDTVHPKRHSGT